MRPDVAAFRELDALVRNLSEQLATYRRRALVAEGRSRDLEQQAAASAGAMAELRAQLEVVQAQRESVQARCQAAELELSQWQADASARQPAPEPLFSVASSGGWASPAGDEELGSENALLRARLDEARLRTGQLAERIRFLRQQANLGGEK